MQPHASFGPLLRKLRQARGVSQERLASDAEVSTKHLSFLETGRAAPSREMVLVLGSALDLPLRERNVMLGAAGFAPVYRESALDSEELTGLRRAIDHLLAMHEPFAAVLIDRCSRLHKANLGAIRFFTFLGDGVPPPVTNVFETVFDPAGLRPFIENWEEVASLAAARMHREVAMHPEDRELRAVLERSLSHPGVPARFTRASLADPAHPFVALRVRKGEVTLRLFSTLTSLGTPLDVTAQELQIESFFPADDATDAFFRALAG